MPLEKLRDGYDARGQDPIMWSMDELVVAINGAATKVEQSYLSGVLDCRITCGADIGGPAEAVSIDSPADEIRKEFGARGQDPVMWGSDELALAIDGSATLNERAYLSGVMDYKTTSYAATAMVDESIPGNICAAA